MRAQFARSKELFDQALDASEGFGKSFLADLPAIDENALVDLHEMRRSVQSGAKAGVAEDGFEESRGRAFAVGAGNMRAGVSAIGAAQAFGKHGDVFKVELCGRGLRGRSQFPAEGKQVTHGGGVVHVQGSRDK